MKTVLVILLFVLVLLQLRLWTGPGSMTNIARLESSIAEQQAENARLEARNSGLMEEVRDLRNGLDSIEERARNELGLIRQGETFYLMVESDPNARQNPPSREPGNGQRQPEAIAPEPPPELIEDDNPYLDIFRDEDDASTQARAADSQDAAATRPAGQ